jgi:hypothetical protein
LNNNTNQPINNNILNQNTKLTEMDEMDNNIGSSNMNQVSMNQGIFTNQNNNVNTLGLNVNNNSSGVMKNSLFTNTNNSLINAGFSKGSSGNMANMFSANTNSLFNQAQNQNINPSQNQNQS